MPGAAARYSDHSSVPPPPSAAGLSAGAGRASSPVQPPPPLLLLPPPPPPMSHGLGYAQYPSRHPPPLPQPPNHRGPRDRAEILAENPALRGYYEHEAPAATARPPLPGHAAGAPTAPTAARLTLRTAPGAQAAAAAPPAAAEPPAEGAADPAAAKTRQRAAAAAPAPPGSPQMPPPPPVLPPAAPAPAFARAPPGAASVLAGLLPVSLPGSSQHAGTYPSAPRAVPLAALTPQQLAYARGAPGYDGRYGWAADDPRALCDQPSGGSGGGGGGRGGQLPLGFSSSESEESARPRSALHPPGQGHGPPQGFVARDRREDSSGADRPSGAQQHEPHYQQVQQPRQQPQQLPHSQHRAPQQQPPQEPSSGVTWGAGGVGDWPAPQEVSLSDAAKPPAHAAASPEELPRSGAAAASAAHLPTGKRPSGVDALLALASACSNAADDGDGAAVDAELEA
jgi:hypothetical protein